MISEKELVIRSEVLDVLAKHFLEEHITLRAHPVSEQNILGPKLVVIEIELKKLIKELSVANVDDSNENLTQGAGEVILTGRKPEAELKADTNQTVKIR